MTGPILILGGASLDTIVQLPELPAPTPQTIWPEASYRALGSTGAGKSLNLVALGHRVVFHTLLGDDHEGRQVRAALQHPRLHLLETQTAAATEQHTNLMTPDGKRISLFVQPPAEPDSLDWQSVRRAARDCALAVVNILGYTRSALPWLGADKLPIWTDLHDYDGANPHHQPFIDAARVIFLSSDNLPDYRQTMAHLVQQGKDFVVCTHGAAGASLLTAAGEWLEQPVVPATRVLDTNGAGDAFFSGFLHRYLEGAALSECLRAGAVCGALCVASRSLAPADLSPEKLGVESTG
ncbi:carbohydrate kinase family protein [Marinobacter arenosus]|uniref:carbohydrate kinase family protein n=1 Tax=Marinobacter arenosus TaxID=2856822 RepID=UPI001C4D9139|nr:carbohydrate kinase family protein [Marinobacter arenosus]MBW0147995.1 carbohydrate kinase family protein [Marinobacter arenosus]